MCLFVATPLWGRGGESPLSSWNVTPYPLLEARRLAYVLWCYYSILPNRRHVSFINFWEKFAPCLAYIFGPCLLLMLLYKIILLCSKILLCGPCFYWISPQNCAVSAIRSMSYIRQCRVCTLHISYVGSATRNNSIPEKIGDFGNSSRPPLTPPVA